MKPLRESCPGFEKQSLDGILLEWPSSFDPSEDPGQETGAELIVRLAKAGIRVKELLTTIHGSGMACFNVVVNFGNSDEEFAWRECAGLSRSLSRESQEFLFSATLTAELFPGVRHGESFRPDEMLTGVRLGVLYKAIQTVAARYLDDYLGLNSEIPVVRATPESATIPRGDLTQSVEHIYQRSDQLYDGQTAIMDRVSKIEEAAARLLRSYEAAPGAKKELCESTLRNALGPLHDDLAGVY